MMSEYIYELKRIVWVNTILPIVMKRAKIFYEKKIRNWDTALNFIYYLRNHQYRFYNKEYELRMNLLLTILKSKINSHNDISCIVLEMRSQENDPVDPLDNVSSYTMIRDLMPILIERSNELDISASDFDDLEECLFAYECAPFVFDLDRGYVKDSPYYSRVKKIAIELTKERLRTATNVEELYNILKISNCILAKGLSKVIYHNRDEFYRKLELSKFDELKECKEFLENNPDISEIFSEKNINHFK